MFFINRLLLVGLLSVGISAATTAQAGIQLFEGSWTVKALGNERTNTIEVQRQQSGSFVTIPGYSYSAPDGVNILDGGSTNSTDSTIVGTRGECQAGKLFIQGRDNLEVVTIGTSCHLRHD